MINDIHFYLFIVVWLWLGSLIFCFLFLCSFSLAGFASLLRFQFQVEMNVFSYCEMKLFIMSSMPGRRSYLLLSSSLVHLLCFAQIDSYLCHTRHFFFNALHSLFCFLSIESFLLALSRQRQRWWTAEHFLLNEQVSIYLVSLLYCFILQIRIHTHTHEYVFNNFK